MRLHAKETHLKYAIINYLKSTGMFAWGNSTGVATYEEEDGTKRAVPYGKVGSSDVFAIIPEDGRFLTIEVKIHPNRPTHAQWEWMLQTQRDKAVGLWANSLEEVIQVMPRIRRGAWIKTVAGNLIITEKPGDYTLSTEPNPVPKPMPKLNAILAQHRNIRR